jgi:hypothetical protein
MKKRVKKMLMTVNQIPQLSVQSSPPSNENRSTSLEHRRTTNTSANQLMGLLLRDSHNFAHTPSSTWEKRKIFAG